jgi:hypothetical protein
MSKRMCAIGVAGIALSSVVASVAQAGADQVQLPEGYADAFAHYATINRADDRKQVVKIFANDIALQSAKDGPPLDSGAVIVMEVYKAKLDASENPVVGADGFFEPDALTFIGVMETRDGWGGDYPDEWRNGSWEYAGFKPDDHSFIERDYQPCFECHKPMHEGDYLFSFEALAKAAGG